MMNFVLVTWATLCIITHKPSGLCLWSHKCVSAVGEFVLQWLPALMNAVRLPLQSVMPRAELYHAVLFHHHCQTNAFSHRSDPKRLVCVCVCVCVGVYAQSFA